MSHLQRKSTVMSLFSNIQRNGGGSGKGAKIYTYIVNGTHIRPHEEFIWKTGGDVYAFQATTYQNSMLKPLIKMSSNEFRNAFHFQLAMINFLFPIVTLSHPTSVCPSHRLQQASASPHLLSLLSSNPRGFFFKCFILTTEFWN